MHDHTLTWSMKVNRTAILQSFNIHQVSRKPCESWGYTLTSSQSQYQHYYAGCIPEGTLAESPAVADLSPVSPPVPSWNPTLLSPSWVWLAPIIRHVSWHASYPSPYPPFLTQSALPPYPPPLHVHTHKSSPLLPFIPPSLPHTKDCFVRLTYCTTSFEKARSVA